MNILPMTLTLGFPLDTHPSLRFGTILNLYRILRIHPQKYAASSYPFGWLQSIKECQEGVEKLGPHTPLAGL